MPRSSGLSLANQEPYSVLLTHPYVTAIGGSQHVVRWQASTPGKAGSVFYLLYTESLPALQDCGNISPEAKSLTHVAGC